MIYENTVSQKPISKIIAPAFYKAHKNIALNQFPKYLFYGGRGGLKSSFTAIEIVLELVKDPDANAICFRKVKDTLRKSVFANILWAIDKLGFTELFKATVSPMEITYIKTGQKIIFSGLDDPAKLKSIKLQKGYFKIAWFEELDEFDGMEEVRNVMQSIGRGGDNFLYFMTFNPPKDHDHWANQEIEVNDPRRYTLQVSYLDVPREWLGEFFFQEAELLKEINPQAYEHEYLGIATGHSDKIVFKDKFEVLEFEEPSPQEIFMSRFFYGVDWGFAKDPTALTRCFIKDQCLFISHEAGGVGVEFPELPVLFNSMPNIKRWHIKADCARPETISYMKNQGYNIEGAKKWTGCVEDGVEYMLGFRKIYIHPRCVETIKEFKGYSYKVDKATKKILPVIDKNQPHGDHYIDSIRYGVDDYITREISILDIL